MKFTKENLSKLTGVKSATWRRWDEAGKGRSLIYKFIRSNWDEFVVFCERQNKIKGGE